MIFMQFLGAFFGAVYARCLLQHSAFARAVQTTISWRYTNAPNANRLQVEILDRYKMQSVFMASSFATA